MYTIQNTYHNLKNREVDENQSFLAVIVPSSPVNEINRFLQLVKSAVYKINQTSKRKWNIVELDFKVGERNAEDNFNKLFNTDLVIAECTDKKPNVFYMVGLCHTLGCKVCSCYRKKPDEEIDIPFNVHGRQSIIYALNSIQAQEEFEKHIIDWINCYD